MHRVRLGFAALAGVLALTGCGDPAPPTSDEIAAEAAKLPKQKPGRYTSITKLVDYRISGASPQEADRFAGRMRSLATQNATSCVTRREIDEGFGDMLRGLEAGDCKVDRFAVEGGKLAAGATCNTVQGVVSKIAIDGTVAAEAVHTRLTIKQRNPALQGMVTMVMEVDSLREGDC